MGDFTIDLNDPEQGADAWQKYLRSREARRPRTKENAADAPAPAPEPPAGKVVRRLKIHRGPDHRITHVDETLE